MAYPDHYTEENTLIRDVYLHIAYLTGNILSEMIGFRHGDLTGISRRFKLFSQTFYEEHCSMFSAGPKLAFYLIRKLLFSLLAVTATADVIHSLLDA